MIGAIFKSADWAKCFPLSQNDGNFFYARGVLVVFLKARSAAAFVHLSALSNQIEMTDNTGHISESPYSAREE